MLYSTVLKEKIINNTFLVTNVECATCFYGWFLSENNYFYVPNHDAGTLLGHSLQP